MTDHILDTIHTRFGRVQDVATVQVGVFVSDGGDGLAICASRNCGPSEIRGAHLPQVVA